jgi:hypothetical protein
MIDPQNNSGLGAKKEILSTLGVSVNEVWIDEWIY